MRKEAGCLGLLLFAVLGLLAACDSQDKSVTLRCKFSPHRTVTYHHEATRDVRILSGDRLSDSFSDTTRMMIEETVLDTIGQTRARLQSVYSWDEYNPIYDDSTGTPTGKFRTDARQTTWHFVQDHNGEIIEFGTDDNMSAERFAYQERLFEQMDPMYPDHPVRIGDSWSNTVKILLTDDEKTDATTTYTIKAFERRAGYDCAVIDYEGMLILPRALTARDGNRYTVSVEKVTRRGTCYFAYREGFVVHLAEWFDLVSDGTEFSDGQTVTITRLSNGSLTTRLIDVEH